MQCVVKKYLFLNRNERVITCPVLSSRASLYPPFAPVQLGTLNNTSETARHQTSNGTQGDCAPFECQGCFSFAAGQVRPMFLISELPVEAVRALRWCCSWLSLLLRF